MGSVPETKRNALPSFADQQQLMAEFPAILRGMRKQTAILQQMTKNQLALSSHQLEAIHKQNNITERLLHKVDELSKDTKVTNLLLSELIAIHRTVISDETDGQRDFILGDAQRRVNKGK
jgi:5,10-methylene-tetrahydrofolate dehydrogenase/methenyl tetrahydrofolate cyclohydrolase